MKVDKDVKKKLTYALIGILVLICGAMALISSMSNRQGVIAENENSEASSEPVKNIETENLPLSKPNTTKSRAEIEKTIDAVLTASIGYYNRYSDFTNFVTKNGFWFNKSSDSYISVPELISSELLTDDFFDEGICFLYIKPDDMAEFIGKEIQSENIMEVFIFYETGNNFIIASDNLEKTEISKDILNKILVKYKTEGSYVMRVYSSDKDFEGIKNTIKTHINSDLDLDFRTLTKNERFAFAIFSVEQKYAELQAFILEKENNEWVVKINDITDFIKPYIEVNKRLINFDLDMLPKYNLSQFIGELQDNYPIYVEYLKEQNYINEADGELIFFSAIDRFAYMEFSGGKKYLGNRTDDDVFMLYPVQSIEEASITMLTINEDAPLFILKQC